MEIDHFRQMGSFSITEGSRTTVSGVSSTICSSTQSFSHQRSTAKSSFGRGDSYSSPEGGDRGGETSSFSRVLFSSFSRPEKERENEASDRPFSSEQTFSCSPFQDGDQQVYQEVYSTRDVDNLLRPYGCVFSHPHCTSLPEVSQVCVGRESLCFPGYAFWPFHSPSDFYQDFSGSSFSPSQPVNSYTFLPGRLTSEEQFLFCPRSSYSSNHLSNSQVGLPDIVEKVGDYPQSEFHFSGGALQNRFGSSFPSRGESSSSFPSGQQFSPSLDCPSSTFSSVDRVFGFHHGCGALGSSSYSSHSVVPEGILASSFSTLGCSDSSFSKTVPSSSLVVSEVESVTRSTSSTSYSFSNTVHRCISDRLGRISRGKDSCRSVGLVTSRPSHQCLGNESSSFGFETFSGMHSRSESSDSFRQHHSCSLSSESGGNSLVFSLSAGEGDSASLQQSEHIGVGKTCSRRSEYSGGCALPEPCPSEHGMGIASSSFSVDCSEMGSASDRLVRNESESQTGDVCLPCSRSEGLGGRCDEHILERNVQLYLPPVSTSHSGSSQGSPRCLQDHSYSAGLAKTVVVSRTTSSILCKAASSSLEKRPSFSIQGEKSTPGSREASSSRLVAVRRSISKKGFSEQATNRISKSVRQSTGLIYDSKWSIFTSWCLSKQIDPLRISAQKLADFFIFLFEEKGYSPSTIKGYRSAIARTIYLSGGSDFGQDEFLSMLLKNFSLERPRQRRLVPAWDLGLVLRALQVSPYEPLDSISLKFLSYKCCFLLALATGRRRSELHALSISDSCLRFSADKSSVTLLTDPAFLAKNQLCEKGSGLMIVPALPSQYSKSLCPVRVLEAYLLRSSSIRSKDSNRLFVPIKKGQKDISAKSISSWVCNTVHQAYKSVGVSLPKDVVKAHEVRAIASSWSIFNSASLSEILSAGFWRSENTFFYHYLRSMQQHSDNLYALGPLVSAQRVVLPPVDSN